MNPFARAKFQASPVLAIAVLSTIAGVLLRDAVLRSTHPYENSYNEGWNTYHAATAARGGRLYQAPPHYTVVNYPPLSFHVIAGLGSLLGDFTIAGRILSLLSTVAIAILVCLFAAEVSGSVSAGAVAGLCYLSWLLLYGGSYVGLDDPQQFGHAVVLAGAFLYVRRPDSRAPMLASCAVLCTGLFIKHNLLAFPAAIGLDVFLRSRKRFALWVSAMALTAAVATLIVIAADGRFFLEHLLSKRSYSIFKSLAGSARFVDAFQVPLPVATIWCALRFRDARRRFFVLVFAFSIVFGGVFRGGAGVNVNVFFDCIAAMSIIAGMAFGEVESRASGSSAPIRSIAAFFPVWITTGLLAAFLLKPDVPARLRGRTPAPANGPQAAAIFRSDRAYMAEKPGPAICEDLLLCYAAGKPLLYDPFNANELVKTGQADIRPLEDEMKSGRYTVIQLDAEPNANRFPDAFFRALNRYYAIDRRNAVRVFYIPKSGKASTE